MENIMLSAFLRYTEKASSGNPHRTPFLIIPHDSAQPAPRLALPQMPLEEGYAFFGAPTFTASLSNIVAVMPKQWDKAVVVAIFKKGDRLDPSNYRPIALLDTCYKLYARVLQRRIADAVDDSIRKTQYGL